MAYDPRAVANLMITLAKERKIELSNGKLQKLLFLAHAIFLVTKGRPLVHSSFEAWQYGPVSREAYDAFKSFGADPISGLAKKRNPATGAEAEIPAPDDLEVSDVVARVVGHYGPWAFSRLVDLTHAKSGLLQIWSLLGLFLLTPMKPKSRLLSGHSAGWQLALVGPFVIGQSFILSKTICR